MDLQTLSRNEGNLANHAHDTTPLPPPRRRWATRVALPGSIALALLLLLVYAASDWLLFATEVNVVRATALAGQPQSNVGADGSQRTFSNTVVAQAPGWVEPDPYPIYITALADGVVKHVHVLEGETVKTGQVLVQLVDDDAKLALAAARAELNRRAASLAAAETDYKEPIALQRTEAVAAARHAEAQAALTRLDAEVAREQARLGELTVTYERLANLTARSVSALKVEAAKFQVESQRAVVNATQQRRPQLQAMIDAAKAEHAAAQRDLELKTELQRRRDEAAAAVEAARTAVAEAELRLERMTIQSPADGIVMERRVAPGSKLKLAIEGKHTAHPIHLYDPASLQVRVDVPLADAAAVGTDQRAIIVVDVLPDVEFDGVVTRLVHQADIAKNTVQFKVAISNPSPLLKPDMLARVKFLGRSSNNTGNAASSAASGANVALPRSAIVADSHADQFVWWVSPSGNRLQRRTVTVGRALDQDAVVIRRGLNPGDVVVNQPDDSLTEGQRVRIKP